MKITSPMAKYFPSAERHTHDMGFLHERYGVCECGVCVCVSVWWVSVVFVVSLVISCISLGRVENVQLPVLLRKVQHCHAPRERGRR